jgi:hypothetical protein
MRNFTLRLKPKFEFIYAGFLSQVEVDSADEYEATLEANQLKAILDEVAGYASGEPLWYSVISKWPSDIAVDMGTAWNLLPASDAIPIAQDIAIKEKKTAHVLVKEGSRAWTWVNASDDIEYHDWVKSCRAGTLPYSSDPDGWGPRVTGGLTCLRHIEYWHFTAQNVLHVFADA